MKHLQFETLFHSDEEISFSKDPTSAGKIFVKSKHGEAQLKIKRIGSQLFRAVFNDQVVVCSVERITENGEYLFLPVRSQIAPFRISLKTRFEKLSSLSIDKTKVKPMVIKAQMPGKVIKLSVKEGDTVSAGQSLLVMEAMKMENDIKAPHAARVLQIEVIPGGVVETGAVLMRLEGV